MTMRTVKVWDIAIRIFHWLVVVFFFSSYLSEAENVLHIYAGYAILGLVVFRIVWGLIGTKYARFADFIYGPKTTMDYLVSVIKGKPIHYIGHNPLGGWMTVLLLVFLFAVTWSGLEAYAAEGKGPLASKGTLLISTAMADEDKREGDKNDGGDRDGYWEEIHEVLANFALFLVFAHIAGVLVSSAVHQENLIKAMITGNKQVSSK